MAGRPDGGIRGAWALAVLAAAGAVAAVPGEPGPPSLLSGDVARPVAAASPAVRRSRAVRVDRSVLDAAAPGDRLPLRLFDDFAPVLVVDRVEAGTARRRWSGRLEGRPGGRATIVARGAALAGLVRDAHGADLVALLVADGQFCGLAFSMQAIGDAFESMAFSVTTWFCAVGNLSLAHELGHNQGCQHDRATAVNPPPLDHGYGYRFTDNGGTLRRTVMALAPGDRLHHFSNPDVLFGGVPTGVPASLPDAADNALLIDVSAPTVAAFRCGFTDCNGNGLDDADDLGAGTSQDADGNGVPDECDVPPVLRVDAGTDTPGDGATWATAIADLQSVGAGRRVQAGRPGRQPRERLRARGRRLALRRLRRDRAGARAARSAAPRDDPLRRPRRRRRPVVHEPRRQQPQRGAGAGGRPPRHAARRLHRPRWGRRWRDGHPGPRRRALLRGTTHDHPLRLRGQLRRPRRRRRRRHLQRRRRAACRGLHVPRQPGRHRRRRLQPLRPRHVRELRAGRQRGGGRVRRRHGHAPGPADAPQLHGDRQRGDRDGALRFVDDPTAPDTGAGTPPLVDMGAFERQACPGDCAAPRDATVDVTDLLAVLAGWGSASAPCDTDRDGDVDVSDLLAVLAAWGDCP
jgi:hypothetical protein